jgi:bla regulator protein blaR1
MPDDLLHALGGASLEGGLFVALVWLTCRAVPSLPPSARTIVWWLAALKLLVALVGPDPVALPVLPARADSARPPAIDAAVVGAPLAALTPARQPAGETTTRTIPWSAFLLVPWTIGVALLGASAMWRVRHTRRIAARARPADDLTQRLACELAARLRLPARPDVRMTDAVDTPQVTGLWRPVVLVPGARFEALDDAEQRMVLCHELLHVKRRDLWLGCVPAAAERLFFFHPLARLAAREYAVAREAACDAHVLRVLGAAPQAYGRLLLRLGVSPARASFAAAGAPSTFSHLKRRLIMLDRQTTRTATRRLGWFAAAAAACAIVPVQLVARPTAVESMLPETAAQSHPAAPSPASVPTQGRVADAARPARPADVPVPHSAAQPAPQPSSAPEGGNRRHQASREFQWVLLRDGEHVSMSGWGDHVERARRTQRDGQPLLWVLREGKEFVITDPAVVAQAERIYQPVGELGEKMGEIGARQGDIGRRMGEVGAKQGAIGARQGALGARQGALGAQQAALALRQLQQADDAALEREQEALDGEMKKLNEQMEALGKEMEAFSKPMEDLGREMEPLAKEMEALGRQMEVLAAKAEADLKALVDDAIKNGKAAEPR